MINEPLTCKSAVIDNSSTCNVFSRCRPTFSPPPRFFWLPSAGKCRFRAPFVARIPAIAYPFSWIVVYAIGGIIAKPLA